MKVEKRRMRQVTATLMLKGQERGEREGDEGEVVTVEGEKRKMLVIKPAG